MAVGGRSSVVRALAAQASDLGLIPGGFSVIFHIPLFSLCWYRHLTNDNIVVLTSYIVAWYELR